MSVLAAPPAAAAADLVRDVVYEAALRLDACDWRGWLALCDEDFRYAIRSYSPEIRRDMTWLDHDRAGMSNLVDLLPKHQTDRSTLARHTSVYRVTPRPDGTFEAVSSVVVFRTLLDGGATGVFAVGKYRDVVRVRDGAAGFVARELRLDTRELGMGSHYPL